MVGFLRWLRSILFGTLNGFAKIAFGLLLILVIFMVIGLAKGDGLPKSMVLTLDLRQPVTDSSSPTPFDLGPSHPSVMDIVIALDDASRDARVKGIFLKLGTGTLSVAQAQEIAPALGRLKAKGKFVMAYAHGFMSTGLGDYLVASPADEIWMQPRSPFTPSGTAAGGVYLRGLLDKIEAEPQIVKRAEYKSAADMYMEKEMSAPDREQLKALLQSVYTSSAGMATGFRKTSPEKFLETLNDSPQFAEDVKKAGLIDRIGYDDDALNAARKRSGDDAHMVDLLSFLHTKERSRNAVSSGNIALIQASGAIVDGEATEDTIFGGNAVIASDDMAALIRDITDDEQIKAIVLRIDSPGGSVTASDQILDALKKAQKRGKPVVVSMGGVAASGGYFVSAFADRIVAQPSTITGSIGVLTGKVAFGKSLGLLGVNAEQLSVGRNALIYSPLQPFTPEQIDMVNRQVDAIYDDFLNKVSTGRKLPRDRVGEIAKGRIWSGLDAKQAGLVDELGGVWQAGHIARKLAKLPDSASPGFRRYPLHKGFLETMGDLFGSTQAGMRAMQGLWQVMNSPPLRIVLNMLSNAPKGQVEFRSHNAQPVY